MFCGDPHSSLASQLPWNRMPMFGVSFINMKPLASIFLCAVGLVACASVQPARAAVDSGQPAPDFTFTDAAGKTQKLSGLRGKIVILEWLNPGCPYVLRHYRSGNMPDTQAKAAAEGAVWLQINSNGVGDLDAAKSAEWQKKYGATALAYIRDQTSQLGRLYGAQTTPHVYVIGQDGTLAYQGAIDDQQNASQANTMSAHNYVKAALAALKAGKPVEKPATTPYGCDIKYGN